MALLILPHLPRRSYSLLLTACNFLRIIGVIAFHIRTTNRILRVRNLNEGEKTQRLEAPQRNEPLLKHAFNRNLSFGGYEVRTPVFTVLHLETHMQHSRPPKPMWQHPPSNLALFWTGRYELGHVTYAASIRWLRRY